LETETRSGFLDGDATAFVVGRELLEHRAHFLGGRSRLLVENLQQLGNGNGTRRGQQRRFDDILEVSITHAGLHPLALTSAALDLSLDPNLAPASEQVD